MMVLTGAVGGERGVDVIVKLTGQRVVRWLARLLS